MSTTSSSFGWVSFSKPKDDWYYLPLDERERLIQSWAAVRDAAIAKGAAHLGDFEVRASSSWARMAMWEFADLVTLTEMIDALSEASYYQYFAEENTFGRKSGDSLATYMTAADHTVGFVQTEAEMERGAQHG
jgi:hypothetical protein